MENFIDFFVNTQTTLNTVDVLFNISLSAVLAFFVKFVFVQYAHTISNRKLFGNIFLLITVCTTLIISLIQSSIALSLGLVGALSIVRFRTAIKEPEELVYLFLCIAIGLGFGANQRLLTLAVSVFILVILVIRGIVYKKKISISETYNFDLVSSTLSLDEATTHIKPFCESFYLKRFSSDENSTNICLQVEFENLQKLEMAVSKLKEVDEHVRISFIPDATVS